jgi:putative flavoprotein involved in K+ transport
VDGFVVTSRADIAYEIAATGPTPLGGPIRGQIPFAMEGRVARGVLPVMWFLANHVLTERTWTGPE